MTTQKSSKTKTESPRSQSRQSPDAKVGVRQEATKWVAKLENAIDRGAETAENVHRSVLDLPFEVLARSGAIEDKEDGGMREIAGRSLGAIYDLVRDINHRVSSLATDLLDEPAPHGPTR